MNERDFQRWVQRNGLPDLQFELSSGESAAARLRGRRLVRDCFQEHESDFTEGPRRQRA